MSRSKQSKGPKPQKAKASPAKGSPQPSKKKVTNSSPSATFCAKVGQNGTMILANREYWTTVSGSDGNTNVVNLPFLPGKSGLVKLDAFAAQYELYNVRKVQIEFHSSVGSTTDGMMSFGVDFDPRTLPKDVAGIRALQPNHCGPVWTSGSIKVPIDRVNRARWMYTGTFPLSTAEVATGFTLMGIALGAASKNVGEFWVSYEIELTGAIKPATALAVTYLSGSAAYIDAPDLVKPWDLHSLPRSHADSGYDPGILLENGITKVSSGLGLHNPLAPFDVIFGYRAGSKDYKAGFSITLSSIGLDYDQIYHLTVDLHVLCPTANRLLNYRSCTVKVPIGGVGHLFRTPYEQGYEIDVDNSYQFGVSFSPDPAKGGNTIQLYVDCPFYANSVTGVTGRIGIVVNTCVSSVGNTPRTNGAIFYS